MVIPPLIPSRQGKATGVPDVFNFKFKLILIDQKTYVNNFFIHFWLSMISVCRLGQLSRLDQFSPLSQSGQFSWFSGIDARHSKTTRGRGEMARRRKEFRISNGGFGNTQRSKQVTLMKNPGGKNLETILLFWLLATLAFAI